jgi:muconolactone delta-isomerase
MEYLVTMTTRVPEGTPDETVQNVRAREAARARELAAQGHLLRLWRPPLQPREWRTLGLFAADNEDQLEHVLASMPLRVWRTDQVTSLSAHPNDPASAREQSNAAETLSDEKATEFLTTFTVTIPDGADDDVVDDLSKRNAPINSRSRANSCGSGRCRHRPAPRGRWGCGEPRPFPSCGRS